MHTLLKLPNARKVVTQLGQVKPGMEVLVLYDYYTTHNVEPLAIALQEAGARAHLLQIAGSTHHGTQFSETVAQAMRASNLVIALTRANAAHTEARQQATRNGVGVIVLPESDAADFFVAAGWNADFDALRIEIEGLADAFTQASQARVTSAAGTDVTMSVLGRRGRALHGFANTIDISAGYCLESSLAPVEGTANGIIVVNASIPGVGVVRDEPVRIEMKDGMAVSITGGDLAEKFSRLLASFNDPNVYNLGELGVGMNPCCSIDGTMLSDESVYGAIQLALGTSVYIGGTVKAAAHYDTIVTDATLELDGRAVLVGTKLTLGD
ncbi:aminopeptidase [Bordetella tumulicola]|uniref:aminopeptidase n=1 Tax=Bordetella tumulicola TaxID=1649133 RepID=UPI0039EDEFEC